MFLSTNNTYELLWVRGMKVYITYEYIYAFAKVVKGDYLENARQERLALILFSQKKVSTLS